MAAVDELRPEILAAAGSAVHLIVEGPNDNTYPSSSPPNYSAPALSPRSTSAPPSPVNTSSPAQTKSSKKANPLVDLIDTEKVYVELLTGIIRKVASAWSRSNFPPPALDAMFRAIEAVYKANRQLLVKLNDIGPNPSSPKALGDLLMRWIDDLDGPYTRYCNSYATNFDVWPTIVDNAKLPAVLAELSAASSPRVPHPSADPSSSDVPSEWTLDMLFELPHSRLRYYKKLYARLLKSTTPGRSDHRLLARANERLDVLVSIVAERKFVNAEDAGDGNPAPGARDSQPPPSASSSVPASLSGHSENIRMDGRTDSDQTRSSVRSSGAGTGSSGDRHSRETAGTSVGNFPSSTSLSAPVTDLEKRLSTERTLDIFNMQPKAVRLQMKPPNLTFQRVLRAATDVRISFVPNSTGQPVVQPTAHVFVLTDLFLVCDRIAPEERPAGPDGPDMWLSYPPLAGKHLKVLEMPGEETSFQVLVMKKETLTLTLENRLARDQLMAHFNDCIDFASNIAPPQRGPSLPSAPSDGPWQPQGEFGSRGPSPYPPGQQTPPQFTGDQRNSGPGFDPNAPPPFGNPQMRGTPPPNGGGYVPPPRGASRGFTGGPPGPPGPPGPGGPFPPAPLNLAPQNQYVPPGQPSPYGPGGPSPMDPRGMPKSASGRSMSQPPSDDRRPYPGPPPGPPPGSYGGPPPGHGYGGFPPGPPNGGYPPGPPNGGYPPHMGRGGPMLGHGPGPGPGQWAPGPRATSVRSQPQDYDDVSPPMSPEGRPAGPVTSVMSAQMKCKIFLQQQHAQWKSLGSAKLKLYTQQPTNVKQLVVESDSGSKQIIISTIVLSDGVERVGKTGIAIELSDQGQRTGVIYMVQLRNETSASGLFDSLLAGSDRARG
ncbi:hypothetical protein BKA62DRAFT_767520 [Auriculariales sp. MPI-PUGE-AT-0066]|nr:hypothetical protein BKA62DRAFT_767520 [Auriculariales sp. MPI-PUGE-AT-0066]